MDRAGLAIAQLALAVAPHATRIWIVCGPGNNGGDGLVAARYLKLWGKDTVVTHIATANHRTADATLALQNALQNQVTFSSTGPCDYDLCIDALFGIGLTTRSPDESYLALITRINAKKAPVIAVDVPSGLNADTGATSTAHVRADYTLSLLTLKPGLFTAQGRDACGEIWFNPLGIDEPSQACALLNASPLVTSRLHNTHKSTFGDVAVVGGAPGMVGAALLAAQAALHGGAGRVYVALLDANHPGLGLSQPELMFRPLAELPIETMTLVAGCGGSNLIASDVDAILRRSKCLVLDADALNAIAQSGDLQQLLAQRSPNTTVLTPHPLEAARLLGIETAAIQLNRIHAAQSLANRYQCTVVLKGSGTVIAAPHKLPCINPTGNARLASAGTGDVLAGLMGAHLAANHDGFTAACTAVFRHGYIAETWPYSTAMTAQDLIHHL